jgi:hypothetical protein
VIVGWLPGDATLLCGAALPCGAAGAWANAAGFNSNFAAGEECVAAEPPSAAKAMKMTAIAVVAPRSSINEIMSASMGSRAARAIL